MEEQVIKAAVSAFQAARVGHNKRRKSEAAGKLARVAAEFLNSGKSITELARMLSGDK